MMSCVIVKKFFVIVVNKVVLKFLFLVWDLLWIISI